MPLTSDRTRLPGLKQRDSRTSEGNRGRLGSEGLPFSHPSAPRGGSEPPHAPREAPTEAQPKAAFPVPPDRRAGNPGWQVRPCRPGGRSRGWRDRPALQRSIFRLLAQGSVDEAGAGGKPGGDRASSCRAGASSGSCAPPGTSRVKCVRGGGEGIPDRRNWRLPSRGRGCRERQRRPPRGFRQHLGARSREDTSTAARRTRGRHATAAARVSAARGPQGPAGVSETQHFQEELGCAALRAIPVILLLMHSDSQPSRGNKCSLETSLRQNKAFCFPVDNSECWPESQSPEADSSGG